MRTGAGEENKQCENPGSGKQSRTFFFIKVILWQLTDTPKCTNTACLLSAAFL